MSRFLSFTVEESLAGRAGALKEYLIGVEVFDRKESYDPRVDPIVRVEARRLRSKLRQYYEADGKLETVRIEYPKGTYVPRFVGLDAPKPVRGDNVIVVLPFANLSADPENEYFSDGLTEELIHALTKLDGLRVVAWHSAAKFRSRPYDFQEIARQLKASVLLEGSVRRDRDRVRITAQLIDAATGFYLWSETYDREMRDLFAVQENIARSIVIVLKIKLSRPVQTIPARTGSNLEAYNLYLKGRFHWNKRTVAGMRQAIELFEQAIALDPQSALAYAGLADVLSLMFEYGMSNSAESMARAKSAATLALSLDSTLAEAATSLALIRSLYDWEWREAEEHYLRALQLNPGYATAHHWYSTDYLVVMGRFDEALTEIKVARELDPLSDIIAEGEAFIYLLQRQYGQAIACYSALVDRSPGFYKGYTGLGRSLQLSGDCAAAIPALERGLELAGEIPNILGALGQTYAAAGREADARRILDRLHEIAATGYAASSCFALVHLGLGEKNTALDYLERGCEGRESPMIFLKVHPVYEALHRHPRLAALIKKIGLE